MLPGHCPTHHSAPVRHVSVGEPYNNYRKYRPARLSGAKFGQPNGKNKTEFFIWLEYNNNSCLVAIILFSVGRLGKTS